MSTGKASLDGDERPQNSNFLVVDEPITKKSRRGSIAAIFSQTEKNRAQPQDGKATVSADDKRTPEKDFSLKSKASVERYDKEKPNPLANDKTKPSAAPKAYRKKRKTFHNIQTALTATQDSKLECLEVTQSKWVQDPADPSEEIVTLTGEISDLDSESVPYSFRWIHQQRDTNSISFEDFEAVLARVQGLYVDEAAVALKCTREAKMKRRTFGKGKYFEPTVHEASGIMGSSVEKVPIKATFVCIPIFALMKQSEEHLEYLNRHSRKPARHPIRSLLQYSNILALDSKRDMRQVVTRPLVDGDDEPTDIKSFIHVPELWALVINMYTVITVAPFSRELLLRENIRLEPPPTKEQRLFVKYTSLRGRLLDLRCQSWYGLLESISKIEFHITDIEKHLNEDDSEYKIIDLRYLPIDQNKWKRIVESAGTRRIDVRLVRIPAESHLTLAFAERKLTACVHATWILLGLPYQLNILELKLFKARKEGAESKIVQILETRIEKMVIMESKIRCSRIFNRMLLYAARSHILNPRQKSKSASKAKTIRAFGRVIMASNLAGVGDSSLRKSSHAAGPALFQNTLQIPEFKLRRPSSAFNTARKSIPEISIGNAPLSTFLVPKDNADTNDAFRATSAGRNSWYEPDLEAQSSQNPELWAAPPRTSFERGPPSRGNQVIPSIVDPYLSNGAMPDGLAPTGISHSNQQHLRPRSAAGRRHSSFGIPGEVLSASPLRLPLRVEDSDSLTKPPPYAAGQQDYGDAVQRQDMAPGLFSGRFGGKLPQERQDTSGMVSILERASKRAAETTFGHVPFFQCQMDAPQMANTRSKQVQLRHDSLETDSESTKAFNGNRDLGNLDSTAINAAKDILSDVDTFIRQGKHDDSENVQVYASDYEEIIGRKRSDAMSMVQAEIDKYTRPSIEIGPDDDDPRTAQQLLLDHKTQLTLSVNALIECFIHQDMLPSAPVVEKIWGIMYNLLAHKIPERGMSVANSTGESGSLESVPTSPTKPEISFIQEAAKEVESIEFKVQELLHMHHSTPDDLTGARLKFPKELFSAFMDFVIYLLGVHLAVIDYRVDSQAINTVKDKVHGALNEAHSTFLLINERVDMDLDQIGYESIRSADTMLGLIVESSLNISCREHAGISGDGTEMDFDIVDLYSRYTSKCVDRAKQEASARVYEDVRLLREEIDTISMVLNHQYNTFNRMLDARESAHQTLDKRFIYRVNSNLDEMIRHFSILSNYAVQAEFWARNSIEVRSENNNKAIYVFTAVTVIFLPMSFMTGVLGMNTYDIRNLTHGQWLFWATAVPLTLFVLVVCLLIVNYKFKLKRRLRKFLMRNRAARSVRRVYRGVGDVVRETYFQRPFMGYGLRVLVPYPLYQRWVVRRTKRRMISLKDDD